MKHIPAHNHWIENLTLLRKLARENMICSKQKQKIQYDRHTRPHNFIVGDKVFIKFIDCWRTRMENCDLSTRGFIR